MSVGGGMDQKGNCLQVCYMHRNWGPQDVWLSGDFLPVELYCVLQLTSQQTVKYKIIMFHSLL